LAAVPTPVRKPVSISESNKTPVNGSRSPEIRPFGVVLFYALTPEGNWPSGVNNL
jgi:hypothetical protein